MVQALGHATLVLLAATSALASLSPAHAQAGRACSAPQPLPDGNTLIACRHLRIEIERGADFSLVERARGPQSGTLRSGAVFIDDQSAGRRNAFQIRTPDAIASVRGTSWSVDVGVKQSSVFVVEGRVAVRRRLDGQDVTLGAGDGVDVAPEASPLTIKHWPPARVQALLARFGR